MKPKQIFTLEQDEGLIEFIRENEALYDIGNRRYCDNQYKNNLWKTIGEKLQHDAKVCKHRWECIRGQYRKIVKRASTGQGTDSRFKWKYEDQLEFLKPYIRVAFNVNETLNGTNNDDEEECSSQDADISTAENSDGPKHTAIDIIENEAKKMKKETDKTANSTLTNYLLEQEKNKDELDHFFDSIKSTVKKFSPADQHLTKKKIFMMVSDIELKYINQFPQQISSYSTFSSDNLQSNVEFHVNQQFDEFQEQSQLSSTQPYVSASGMSIPSRPSSTTSLPQSSTASSYYEKFSPTYNE